MLDLDDRFARAFQDEPPLPPVADRVAAGRRALRRRRAGYAGGTALATAAMLVVVPVLGADVLGGGTGSGAPATSTSAAPSSPEPSSPRSSDPAPPRSEEPAPSVLAPGWWASYDGEGRLVLRDGVQVLQRIRDPWPGTRKSVALTLRKGEETKWYLLEWSRGSSSAISDPAGKAFATLRQWTEDQVRLQQSANPVSWVRFRPGTATLVPTAGVTLVRQVADPRVPGFAEPGDTTAAAEVKVDGERWYVLARRLPDGSTDALPTAGAVGGATLADFLDHARAQYSSGEGLR